jgi:hypothetical protein
MNKIKVPQPDTEQSLFYSAINALRIAGQKRIADDLDQRMEELISSVRIPKIAVYVSCGILQAVRSNIGQDLEVELVDKDNEPDTADDRWEELETELEFGNY